MNSIQSTQKKILTLELFVGAAREIRNQKRFNKQWNWWWEVNCQFNIKIHFRLFFALKII